MKRDLSEKILMKKSKDTKTLKINFNDNSAAKLLYGVHDENLKNLQKLLDVRITARGNSLTITGERINSQKAKKVIDQLYEMARTGQALYSNDIDQAVNIVMESSSANLKDVFQHEVLVSSKNRLITPKSKSQKEYVDMIRKFDIVFGIGPAGTGKTYLAMAMAVAFLLKNEFERIILTRPAVEAGEKLGFLPGDLYEKVNPYLRPLYDALYDMMNVEKANQLVERGIVEVAPLAFMRGRTLNNSFVILDEAQNTTSEQMKMFLTRLGLNSKAIITGDVTQIDLPKGQTSGLIEASKILNRIPGISFVYFTEKDVVRHSLVRDIIKAYDKNTTVISPHKKG